MMFTNLLLIFSLLTSALAHPTPQDLMAIHEQRNSIPESFVNSGPAPLNEMLSLRIALVQGNMASLEEVLMNVSTPGHPQYGQHLSKEEVSIVSIKLHV